MATAEATSTRATRIAEANAVLATFEPRLRLSLDGNRVRITYDHPTYGRSRPASLNESRQSIDHRIYRQMGMGGTSAIAVGQLVRWVRDLSRLPMRCWQYWAAPGVGLGTPETIALLEASTYPDPVKTACVLCGRVISTLDWWHRDKLSGPCCTFGNCPERLKVDIKGDAR